MDLGTKTIETGENISVTFLTDKGETETIEGEFVGVCMDLTDGSPLLLVDEGNDFPESVGFGAVEYMGEIEDGG